jgi:phage terminase large subunit
MIEGLWAIASGAVFANFDPDLHVVKSLPEVPMDQLRIGIDYGSRNPTTFLKACRYGPQWIITEEYYHRPKEQNQKTNSQYVSDLIGFIGSLHPTSIECDPSAAAFIHEVRKAGIKGVHGADNDVLGGIQKISQALNAGLLKISEACPNLLEEMGSYSWDDKAAAMGIDKPIKSGDHAIDALKYIINAIY